MEGSSLFVRQASFLGGGGMMNDRAAPFVFHLHKHDSMNEMLLIEQGTGEFVIDGRRYLAEPGTLLLYQRGIWHEERSTKYPFRAVYVSFAGLELRGLPAEYLLELERPQTIELKEHFSAIRTLMHDVVAAGRSNEPEAQTIADHLLGILLAKLVRIVHYTGSAELPAKQSIEAVHAARRHIEENYRESITLDKLAQLTYVNKYHLAHSFKRELGVSPIQFLIRYRMEVAQHYLRTTDHPAWQIAEWVGYQSEPSFYNAFRALTGMTPGEFREASRQAKIMP